MSFKGKTAVITGAGMGLGLTYARALSESGANVVLSDLGADRLGLGSNDSLVNIAVRDLQAEGKKVVAHMGNLAEEQICRQLIELAIESFGTIDILIHNAGWVGYQSIEDISPDFLDRSIGVNINAPIWLCKYAWQHLKRSSAPRIVLTSSDRAMFREYAQSGLAAYAAGKMAQLGIMNALSIEGAEHRILVNAVSPIAKTRMWGVTEEPLTLKPEWVTPGVIYLASAACYDTGYILRASNGQFTATRFYENTGVDYPEDLARVKARSIMEVAQLWETIKEN